MGDNGYLFLINKYHSITKKGNGQTITPPFL